MAIDEKPEWYQKDVTSINPDAQQLPEDYSGFKSEDVLPNVLALVSACKTLSLDTPLTSPV
jgi:hypothetical protein